MEHYYQNVEGWFEDGSLYHYAVQHIDASHDYTNVMADIKAWYPKIKFGGTMSGDDYCSGWQGVVDAVDEYFGAGNTKLYGKQYWAITKS